MCQVAVSVREVRLEFQGCAVRCNGLWDVSRILKVKRNIGVLNENALSCKSSIAFYHT